MKKTLLAFSSALLLSATLGLCVPQPPPAGPQDPQTVLGNIFLNTEPLLIQALADGSSVDYTVKDFWGQTVATGAAPVEGGVAKITPDINKLGYYDITVNSGTGSRDLTFAILSPIDYKDYADSPFGVCAHFASGWSFDVLPLVPRIGLSQIREDMPWRWVERDTEGKYDWSMIDGRTRQVTHRLDDVHNALKELGIPELPISAFCSARIYDRTEAPITPAGCAGYGRYCVEVLKHFPDFKQIELWNEYNGSWGPPKGTPPDRKAPLYTQMCKAAYEAIKAYDPSVEVLGGAMVRVPIPYLEELCKAGCLQYLDALVVHPYIGAPEVFEPALAKARALMRQYNNGVEKPIWATEFAWGLWGVSPQEQATYLVRASVIMLANNVQKMHWFELHDSQMFMGECLLHSPTDPRGKYSPTQACVADATMIRVLHKARFEAREAYTPFTRAWVYRFRGQDEIRVCWCSGEDKSRIVVETGAPLTRIDIMGNETRVVPQDGRIVLPIDNIPFYLKGPATRVAEVPTQYKAIANSSDDFTETQGNNGWYMGYYDGGAGPAPGAIDPNSFQPLKLVTNIWGYNWANGPAKIEEASFWPDAKTRPVMRWVSTMDGEVTIRGSFKSSKTNKDTFSNVEQAIYVDGKPAFDKVTTMNQPGFNYMEPFEFTADVRKGTPIDFVVLTGPNGSSHPRLDASICVPNPAFKQ
jgi:hypothetical protein